MRKTYRGLAHTIAILVVVQAMMIIFAVSGLFHWVDEGATLDKSVMDGWADEPPTFTGAFGHFFHALIGPALIALLALILLIVSFFAKVPRGVPLAAAVLVLVLLQYMLGIWSASESPYFGLVHGLNAFLLLGAAIGASTSAKNAGATEGSPAPVA